MTIATSILALLISVASLAFGIYQYRILHTIRVREKGTTLLRLTYELRRKSQKLQSAIDSTDDIDDHADFIANLNLALEMVASKIAIPKATSINTLAEAEQRLLQLELEIDLVQSEVDRAGEFFKESRESGDEA